MSNTPGDGSPAYELVTVEWETALETNRHNWDDRAPLHEEAYGIEKYVEDTSLVSSPVRHDLPVLLKHLGRGVGHEAQESPGPLEGLDVIHLQCHIGTDTISLARCGACVTGLDFSPASLDAARRLAARTGDRVTWVESDVMAAREAVTGDFDVVYTSIGVLCWLDGLDRWASQAAALLRPGGVFYLRDDHAALLSLDENDPDLRVRYRYFRDDLADRWDDPGTYAGDGTVAHSRTYQWPHPPSEVITALLGAGLRLERFDEHREMAWRFSPHMVQVGDDSFAWPGPQRDRVPCSFTVVARKP